MKSILKVLSYAFMIFSALCLVGAASTAIRGVFAGEEFGPLAFGLTIAYSVIGLVTGWCSLQGCRGEFRLFKVATILAVPYAVITVLGMINAFGYTQIASIILAAACILLPRFARREVVEK